MNKKITHIWYVMLCNLINETRQAMSYNVTFRRVPATTVEVKKQRVLRNACVRACVFEALGIQHAMSMRHIIICGLLRSTYFHIISSTAQFSEKKVIEHKTCVSTNLS
jgi:hypothetical protein